jgi:hypothetical protein
MTKCAEIKLVTALWRDAERFGVEIMNLAEYSSDSHQGSGMLAKLSLFFLSQRERDQWADILCLRAPSHSHRNLYSLPVHAESEQYELAVKKIQEATIRFVKRITNTKEKAYLRMFTSEADKKTIADDDHYKSTVFMGHGIAFILSGFSLVTESIEVLSISLTEWGLIERREHLRQLDALTRFLERQPSIKMATKKDLAALSSSATVASYTSGDIIQVSSFNEKHVVLIQDGLCTLGKVQKRLCKNFRNDTVQDSKTNCTG